VQPAHTVVVLSKGWRLVYHAGAAVGADVGVGDDAEGAVRLHVRKVREQRLVAQPDEVAALEPGQDLRHTDRQTHALAHQHRLSGMTLQLDKCALPTVQRKQMICLCTPAIHGGACGPVMCNKTVAGKGAHVQVSILRKGAEVGAPTAVQAGENLEP
jgi:hypothetical protein